MSENYFKIFKNPDDHDKWSKQIEYAAIADNLDADTRQKLVSALETMVQIMGKSFLKTSHVNHPVRQMVSEKTEFRIYQLIEFADTIKTLKLTDTNFPKLQKKLLSKQESKREGVPFVEIAQTYIKENFIVNFLEENNFSKTPDIKITNPENNEVFYIEVSTLNDGPEKINSQNNHYFFHSQFHYIPPQNSFVGEQKEPINKEDYPEIEKIIANAKCKVEEHNQIVFYTDKRFYFLLAPKGYDEDLKLVCEKYALRLNTISGLPLNFNETDRIVNNKIRDKAKQIPQGSNGLIYFPVAPLFFITTDIKDITSRVEEYILSFKNIIGIVIFSKIVANKEQTSENIGRHLFKRKTIKNLSYESLFIHNKNCELYISNNTLEKIYRTL